MKNITIKNCISFKSISQKINMMCLKLTTILIVWFMNTTVYAQVLGVGTSTSSGSSGAAGKVNKLLQFVIDFIVEIGALVSVVFALGLILAVKFGLTSTQKIKDWGVVVLFFLIVPWLIPAIFTAAKSF